MEHSRKINRNRQTARSRIASAISRYRALISRSTHVITYSAESRGASGLLRYA